MTVTLPPDTDLSRCHCADYSLWRTEPRGDSTCCPTTPGLADHLWILDVDGTRLVLVAALHPGESQDLHRVQPWATCVGPRASTTRGPHRQREERDA